MEIYQYQIKAMVTAVVAALLTLASAVQDEGGDVICMYDEHLKNLKKREE